MSTFTIDMLKKYHAVSGAYSNVTKTEADEDKSVTLDGDEKTVLFSVYTPDIIKRKGIDDFGNEDKKEFNVLKEDGSINTVVLSIVFPKPNKNELRLYFNKKKFAPKSSETWFIFSREGESTPYIGSMNSIEFYKEMQRNKILEQLSLDEEDDQYQKEVTLAELKVPSPTNALRYPRDPQVAVNALEAADYLCEGDSSHKTFLKVNGKPYMEAHHIIPISLQACFSVSLDVTENIAALCPYDHRLVHYGAEEEKTILLKKLWEKRFEGLHNAGIEITYEEFIGIY